MALHCCWPSLAAVRGQKNTSVFSYYLENGFFFWLIQIRKICRFGDILHAAEWSRVRAPRTRHKRYDSCFGYRRSRVRSPVRPTLIFLSLEATLPERPPVRPRSREVPVSSTPQGQKTDEPRTRPVGTRDPPTRVCGRNARDYERLETNKKYKTLFLNPQSPRSPRPRNRRPLHNLR